MSGAPHPLAADAAATATATAAAALPPRALPVLLSAATASAAEIESWHRSVLAAHSSGAVTAGVVLFASAAAVFACLLLAFHRCAARWRRDSHFGRLWTAWSPMQRLEWTSYAVSTVHAIAASLAGTAALAHSLLQLHAQSDPPPQSQWRWQHLWAAVEWFVRTSLHPLPSQSPQCEPSSVVPCAAAAASAFELAVSTVFGASTVRDCALLVTAAYLLVDLALCLASTAVSRQPSQPQPQPQPQPQLASPLTVLHHCLILLAFGWGLATHTGTAYMCGLLLNELSTPFLNANYFLAASRVSLLYPRLYVLNGAVLLVVFVCVRLLWNAALLGHIALFSWTALQPLWRSDSRWLVPTAVRWRCAALSALCCGHVSINAVWAVQLGRAVHRKWSNAAVKQRSSADNHSGSGSKRKQL